MRSRALQVLAACALFILCAAGAEAGTVRGTVNNGTTGKPAAGVDLTLVQPMGGMQELAHTKSGAQGEFTFDHPNLGTQPMLVRATYHGIHFNTMAPPGSSTIQVDIYEPSEDAKTIHVPSHVVIFQPNGATLLVGEEYQIENKSQPPRAYFRAEGNFDFALPENARLKQVAAAGPAGMPIVQVPIDKKNNRYAIAFAFRPSDSTVRYSYELPYADNAAAVKLTTIYPGGRLLVVAPPTVQVSGPALEPSGQEQGMSLYVRKEVPAGTLLTLNVSGTAPHLSADSGGDQGQQGRDAQQSGAETGGVAIRAVPGRLDALKWPLIGVLAVFFGFFGYLLSIKQVVVTGAEPNLAEAQSADRARQSGSGKPPASSPTLLARNASEVAPTNGAATLKEVDEAIGISLDALKESLFRLELRRQAGTISEEDYARERAKAERVLRDLVRG